LCLLGLQVRKSHALGAYLNVIHPGIKPENALAGRSSLSQVGVEGLKIEYYNFKIQVDAIGAVVLCFCGSCIQSASCLIAIWREEESDYCWDVFVREDLCLS
jgi:hypothetical protein